MLAVRSLGSQPRRFQGRGGIGAAHSYVSVYGTRRGLRGLGDDTGDFSDLTGYNTTGDGTGVTSLNLGSTTNLGLSPANMGVYNLNETNAPAVSSTAVATMPSSSGSSSGPSWTSILAGVLPGLTSIGATLAKNLTTPYATITSTPYGTTESIPVGSGTSPSSAFGALGLSSSIQSLMPLLLIGGALMLFANMEHR